MTALGTALAVAGGLYLYYNVIAKPADEKLDANGDPLRFGGRRRRQ